MVLLPIRPFIANYACLYQGFQPKKKIWYDESLNGLAFETVQALGSGLNYHKKGLRTFIRRICSGEILAKDFQSGVIHGLSIPEARAS